VFGRGLTAFTRKSVRTGCRIVNIVADLLGGRDVCNEINEGYNILRIFNERKTENEGRTLGGRGRRGLENMSARLRRFRAYGLTGPLQVIIINDDNHRV